MSPGLVGKRPPCRMTASIVGCISCHIQTRIACFLLVLLNIAVLVLLNIAGLILLNIAGYDGERLCSSVQIFNSTMGSVCVPLVSNKPYTCPSRECSRLVTSRWHAANQSGMGM